MMMMMMMMGFWAGHSSIIALMSSSDLLCVFYYSVLLWVVSIECVNWIMLSFYPWCNLCSLMCMLLLLLLFWGYFSKKKKDVVWWWGLVVSSGWQNDEWNWQESVGCPTSHGSCWRCCTLWAPFVWSLNKMRCLLVVKGSGGQLCFVLMCVFWDAMQGKVSATMFRPCGQVTIAVVWCACACACACCLLFHSPTQCSCSLVARFCNEFYLSTPLCSWSPFSKNEKNYKFVITFITIFFFGYSNMLILLTLD